MRILSRASRFAALALLVAAALPAQTTAKAAAQPTCDPKDALLNSPTGYRVQRATIVLACPEFEKGGENFAKANLDTLRHLDGVQALGLFLHANVGFFLPPKDTAIAPVPAPTPVPITPSQPPDTVTHPTPVPPAPPTVNAWTKLGAAGNLWSFVGLRVVRWTLGDSAKALYTTAYGQIECGLSGFNNKAPSGGSGVGYCESGPPLLDTLNVPMAIGPITGSSIVTPKGSPGVSLQQVRSSGGGGIKTDGTGSFRTTCMLAKFVFDDPIVYPNTKGVSHLHMLFGNTAVDGYTNSLTLASSGNSTCLGGILNRTAYWTPAMVDANGNAKMPDRGTFYYKTGQYLSPAETQTLPVGLKMIAGDKNATGPQFGPDLSDPAHPKPGPMQTVTWICLNGSARSANDATIPACKAGDEVRLTVIFPQCWDGVNLDSPDHKSHVAYPIYSQRKCPSTHPVMIPEITEHFDFPVAAGENPTTWHLSSDMDLSKPGGLSAHADWMNGWDPATMLLIVENCLQKALDCEIGGLGGRILY